MSAYTRLTVHAAEAGARLPDFTQQGTRMTVDMLDIRAWRFFATAPSSFFEQYADDFVILNAHVAENFLDKAVEFLEANLLSTLTVSGRFNRRAIEILNSNLSDKDVGLVVHPHPAFRSLKAKGEDGTIDFEVQGDFPNTLAIAAHAGMPTDSSTPPAEYWTTYFRKLVIEDIIPELRMRDKNIFFLFMKALASMTAQGLNWSRLGELAEISAPSARDWTHFLSHIGVVDLVDPMTAPAPRRAKLRPKLYWTSPGLALWLSESMNRPSQEVQRALSENLAYLALKDAFPQARFLHFLDTNNVRAHWIIVQKDLSTAYFMQETSFAQKDALRNLKSLSKIGLVAKEGFYLQTQDDVLKPVTMQRLTC